MNAPYQPPHQSWKRKFQCAFHGIALGVWGQSSFAVHGLCFVVVVAIGACLRIAAWEWIALLLASALVLCTELLNSALEALAKATTDQYCEHVDRTLKIASGAVLLAALFAVAVGVIVFLPHLLPG